MLTQLLPGYLNLAFGTTSWDKFATRIYLVRPESAVFDLNGLGPIPSLRFDQLPALSGCHVFISVDNAITIFVTVSSTSCSFFPVGIVRVDGARSLDAEMLNIAPRKVGSLGKCKEKLGDRMRYLISYRASSASAKTPTAFGAAAEVPP
jgi:hypothetical protein